LIFTSFANKAVELIHSGAARETCFAPANRSLLRYVAGLVVVIKE